MNGIRILFSLAFLTGCFAQEDIRVASPKGDFIFRNVQFEPDSSDLMLRIKGTVTNQTGLHLSGAWFKVTFFDQKNRPLNVCTVPDLMCRFGFNDLGPGMETEIGNRFVTVSNARLFRKVGAPRFSIVFDRANVRARLVFVLEKPAPSDALTWEDDTVVVALVPALDGVGMMLQNKTQEPIKIDWNTVSYIDPDGQAHKVIHAGVRLIQKDQPQAPTLIPPMSKITETVFPADLIKYIRGWKKQPLWQSEFPLDTPESEVKQLEGKNLSLFLPLEVNGKVKNYTFVMKVKSVEL